MLDTVKGSTIWQVSRFDVSFEEHLYEKINNLIRPRIELNPEITRIGWCKNVYQNTDIKALIDNVPKFENLNIWQREIILGQAKEFIDALFRKGEFKPYDVEIKEGNVFLNEGINNIWDILCGNGSTTLYNNANARLGVGNDATAPAATQTGLLGGSTLFKAMDASFPTSGSAQQGIFQSTFGTSEANFAWNEESVDNGNTANKNIQRSNTALGTKPSSESWILKSTLTMT